MEAKKWDTEVASFCPGVGRGRLWSEAEIRAVVDRQRGADEEP
jgi:hypothetical protein